jgi:MYXO-CTERM domain-containing protein
MKPIGSMRRLLAWACLLLVMLMAASASAARVQWKSTRLKEKKISEDEGRWHIELTIYLDRSPNFANMPVKFEFRQQSSVERFMEGESDKIKTRTIPIVGAQPVIESVDLGFLDPGTGTIQKRTKFAFDISRAHGFEAGDWQVKITDARSGAPLGATTRMVLEGENKVVDRRTMSFAAGDKKDEKKKEDAESGEEKEKAAPSAPVEEDETSWPEDKPKRPPPVKEKRGCGCRLVETSGTHAMLGAWLILGLSGAWGLRRRRTGRR